MQQVVGYFVQADVVPHVAPGPFGQRVEFDAARVRCVEQRYVRARARLFAPQPGDPGLLAGQRVFQRHQFADVAAGFAQCHAFVHGVFSFARHELHHGFGLRPVDVHRRARRGLELVEQLQGFAVQHAGLQYKDAHVEPQGIDQVADHHVLGTQARRLRDRGSGVARGARMVNDDQPQQGLGLF